MADVLVTCVLKDANKSDSHTGITHLGGANWFWTAEAVIASIRARTNTFYTMVGGRRANVGVVEGQNGPYLRTHADGSWNNNLLALPTCRNR
jgi:hypothetical protein